MGREVIHTVRVEFGDCDPARIVWIPNFSRWIDAASRNFFVQWMRTPFTSACSHQATNCSRGIGGGSNRRGRAQASRLP